MTKYRVTLFQELFETYRIEVDACDAEEAAFLAEQELLTADPPPRPYVTGIYLTDTKDVEEAEDA